MVVQLEVIVTSAIVVVVVVVKIYGQVLVMFFNGSVKQSVTK